MAPSPAGAKVGRMIRRPASSLFAVLLVLFQLLLSPLSHGVAAAHEDCAPAGQATHVSGGGTSDCGNCPDEQVPSVPASASGEHSCHSHVACNCPCSHTPALSVARVFFTGPTPPDAVVTVLPAPAFDPPIFDFLRPPN